MERSIAGMGGMKMIICPRAAVYAVASLHRPTLMIASFYCSIFGTHLSTEGINRGRYSSKNFMLIIINILLQVYAPHSGH